MRFALLALELWPRVSILVEAMDRPADQLSHRRRSATVTVS